ncbi:hypothetical protein TSOC_006967 [Tetrabaena socialis]|uniref:ATP-dependent DNA helicase n=1 Tax=Tetrabaena socialis TaxID=47790 RepID=A0A2J8A2B7_9CHLO|nr:hypothetical protein TSOC_006967 [Tetrabaena socialis]|eukprot:PNH06660.1 hypothetical protein TSOC_006967 [Tetrabaena socialis]
MANYMHQRYCDVRGVRQWMANLHTLFVGDFFQVRPIGEKWIFHAPFCSGLHAVVHEGVRMFELTQIMRTKNAQFAERLNRLRENGMTNADDAHFRTLILEGRLLLTTRPC